MGLVPDYAATSHPDFSAVCSVDWDILAAAISDTGVLPGFAPTVTAQGSPNMTVNVSAGRVMVQAVQYITLANAVLAIGSNSSGSDRIDLVYVTSTGIPAVTQGSPATHPKLPALPAGAVALAAIYVVNGATSITSTEILSKSVGITDPPVIPWIGAKTVLFGHSLTTGGGVQPYNRGWADKLSASMRGFLWDQGIGGAVLAMGGVTSTTTGCGGITQVLQGLVPNPGSPIKWRGPYVSTTVYHDGDGVTSGGYWFRNVSGISLVNLAPPAGSATWPGATSNGWQQVMAGGIAQGPWACHPFLSIFMFGNNDLGNVYQKNSQPFLNALETALARFQSSMVWEALVAPTNEINKNITYSWASPTIAVGPYGSGPGVVQLRGTTGDTITVSTPPDFPGGFVDFGFTLVPQAGSNTLASGALNFQVDAVNVNTKYVGQADGPLVNLNSPNRHHIQGLSLTTAISNAGAITSIVTYGIPAGSTAPVSGNTLNVGMPGSVDTFNITAVSTSAGHTTFTVTSKTPTFNHAIGDSAYPSTGVTGWAFIANTVVRVPVSAGSHSVVATVQASPAMAGVYHNYVQFEPNVNQPQAVVTALFKPINYAAYWPTVPNDSDVATWNTAVQNVVGSTAEFNHLFLDIFANALKPATTLTTGITAGQTAITSLATASVPAPIASGDHVYLGSGVTQESCVASGVVAAGATSIPVTSFTATYAHAIGDTVFDYNNAKLNFFEDDVHPSENGHAQLLGVITPALYGLAYTDAQISAQTSLVQPSYNQQGWGANLVVNTVQWQKIASTNLNMPAEPGDIIELTFSGSWDASASITGFLDLACINPDTTDAAATGTITLANTSSTMTTSTSWPAGIKGMMVLGSNLPVGTYVQDVASTTSLTLSKPATGTAVGTYNFVSVIDWVSSVGVTLGPGIGQTFALLGTQQSNGLSALKSVSASASVFDKASGTFWFPVQHYHLVGGQVTFALYSKVGSAGTRNIVSVAGTDKAWMMMKNLHNISTGAVA